jgi:hypothetical protein
LCGRGQGCVTFNDCTQNEFMNGEIDDNQCVAGLCVQALPASCEQLFRERGARADGVYTIDRNDGDRDQFGVVNTFCNMTEGGWTLVWMVNSQFVGTHVGGNQAPQLGELFARHHEPAGLAADPRSGLFGFGSLPFHPMFGMRHSVFRWVSYDNGVERFRSDELPKTAWRIDPVFSGYQLFGPKYFMCNGDFRFTDEGIGQVDKPPGATDDCKGHSGLAGGYDFSETATRVNEGLMASGRFDFLGPRIAPNNGVMTTAPANVGGRFVNYGTPGAIQTLWIK